MCRERRGLHLSVPPIPEYARQFVIGAVCVSNATVVPCDLSEANLMLIDCLEL